MVLFNKQRSFPALVLPLIIFTACAFITASTKFKANADKLSVAVLLDMLIVAPVAYYAITRKRKASKVAMLRVFMAGVVVSSFLLSRGNVPALAFIRMWIAPVGELTLVSFIAWKFYSANKLLRNEGRMNIDFLVHCRAVLGQVMGNQKAADIVASEVAVFYYTFKRKNNAIDNINRFTTYKESGIILVLGSFLGLFMVETASTHFLFMLWSHKLAWVLTTLSFYTCMQLFAHIRALRSRPVEITAANIALCNGIMGGDVTISIDNIKHIELNKKPVAGTDVIKLAFINGLEHHNVAIYLKEPVIVTKAFGMKKTASIILLSVDKCGVFVERVNGLILNSKSSRNVTSVLWKTGVNMSGPSEHPQQTQF